MLHQGPFAAHWINMNSFYAPTHSVRLAESRVRVLVGPANTDPLPSSGAQLRISRPLHHAVRQGRQKTSPTVMMRNNVLSQSGAKKREKAWRQQSGQATAPHVRPQACTEPSVFWADKVPSPEHSQR